MKNRKGFWVPIEVLDIPGLSILDRVMLAEIKSLTKLKDGCTADNDHFIKCFTISERTVSRSIARLVEEGHIKSVLDRAGKGSTRTITRLANMAPLTSHNDGDQPSMCLEVVDNVASDIRNTNSFTNSTTNTYTRNTGQFERFWEEYPKKRSKGDAQKAFDVSRGDLPPINDLIMIIKKWKETEDWTKENGKFIPYPATWLRAAGWLDALPQAKEDDYLRIFG